MSIHRIALLTLVVAGVAAAGAAAHLYGNSASYMDPAGDAGAALDISNVSVANTDRGDVTFKITIAGRPAAASDWVAVYLDVDNVEDTEGSLRPEYALVADSDGGHFLRFGDGDPDETPAALLTGFASSFENGLLTFRVNQRDLADATDLNVWLTSGRDDEEVFDDAPDGSAVWEYRIVSPTLYVLAFSPPKSAKAGETVRGLISVRGASQTSARIGCAASIAGRRVQGKADWFTLSIIDRGSGSVRTVQADPRCAWAIPKGARGKVLRGTMSVTQAGLQVSRSFVLRVR